jgi:hypothetical protein
VDYRTARFEFAEGEGGLQMWVVVTNISKKAVKNNYQGAVLQFGEWAVYDKKSFTIKRSVLRNL